MVIVFFISHRSIDRLESTFVEVVVECQPARVPEFVEPGYGTEGEFFSFIFNTLQMTKLEGRCQGPKELNWRQVSGGAGSAAGEYLRG